MIYEISSGNGPAECELAVTKLAQYFVLNYGAEIIETSSGYNKETYRFVAISCKKDLSEFIGSVLWVCRSPYRPKHKRKNWFVNFIPRNIISTTVFDERQVEYATCHSGGKGGQNVNKVETGVHAVYLPTGDAVFCTDERSQYANKKKALMRLKEIVAKREATLKVKNVDSMRLSHANLERGNASVRFDGEAFVRR